MPDMSEFGERLDALIGAYLEQLPADAAAELREALATGVPGARPVLVDGQPWVEVTVTTAAGVEPVLDVAWSELGFRPGPNGPERIHSS